MDEVAYEMTGGNLADLPVEKVARLFTIATHVFDLCLNELERRGTIVKEGNTPILPYCSDYAVETLLTRDQPVDWHPGQK